MKTLEAYRKKIEQVLDAMLSPISGVDCRLTEAMRYSVLGGGKRIRPLLVYATGEALGVPENKLDALAVAVELIHVYSLIHDDLPSMDNDDLRRGKPTSHIAFDEAMAILAGDALQTLAFEILSTPLQGISAKNQLKIINILSTAAGMQGMINGQCIDLSAVGNHLSEKELETMHLHKTGALIKACVLMPTYCDDSVASPLRENLLRYAQSIGLAFQVHDDILDIESDTETLGKQQGADIAADKPTYPSIVGLKNAKKKAFDLYSIAIESISGFGEEAQLMREIASFIVKRTS